MKITTYKTITRKCDFCGKTSQMDLTEQEYTRFERYLCHGGFIQECLPELNPCEREFLKSGYCKDCQEMIFGNGKSNRIK